MTARLRCAIYTRKSTEEGLEQNFNSLHAQREACEAYIMSQTGEGWVAVKTPYDDGGFSGGSLERPALGQLLEDIRRGRIDIVVVYKVDRLTRSLADFAKIVETFDTKGVSFVSVTQAFNTTSSMGRLTLNVLLSFAQFEREVTGERIRDKVAASKAKGLRMGGRPPLGYDIVDGKLAVNPEEAPRARRVFESYLELGSLKMLEREGVESKRWVNRQGERVGGGHMNRGALYYLLTNPAYRGVTRHKEKAYEDTHPAIIDVETWDAVQHKLSSGNGSHPESPLHGEPALLQGKLFDDRGNPMIAVHTKRGGKRYRYYLSRARLKGSGEAGSVHRVSTGILEQFLVEALAPKLAIAWMPDAPQDLRLIESVHRVCISADEIAVEMANFALEVGGSRDDETGISTVRIPFHMRRKRGALILEGADKSTAAPTRIDRVLVRGVVMARAWAHELEQGQTPSITRLAQREGMCSHYAARMLPLAYLAPDLVEQIIEGRQPQCLTLQTLTSGSMPLEWAEQRRWFENLTTV
ncbi:MAG: recombinase family protein [Phenylobacterium sp.]|uniref:recombinase family protein n=1 Tax=Phenylobacterium sp. TaxID=1871053 RepID=UPI0027337816|nr:recombinase family protein [Phenylobacterium sp.]MDP3176108.1 recombinase family protein [Phenylobacterium sp.]